ncbi:hypothetical protein Tco_0619663 [Tanacetum coccineum]
MVAYLERPTNSDDFTKIVDFLNANPIRYALTVNPTIYVSCIEQFWSTAKAQTINEETQIHALVDGKKIVITESSVRRDLQFADEDGTDCLPTTTIFENLKLMGYENLSDKLTFFKSYFSHQWKFLVHTILQCLSPKKTAWNEFSSNIASAIICLATNQKFNFSKMVFDGKVTPLFDTMLIQHQSKVGDSLERDATTASSLEAEHVVVPGAKTPWGTQLLELDESRIPGCFRHHEKARTHEEGQNSRVEKGRFDDEHIFVTSVFNDEDVFAGQDMADQEVNVVEKEVSVTDPVTTAGEVVTTASVDISTASVLITVSTATPTTTPTTTIEDDMTLAETLMEIKSAKLKAIGVVMQEPSEIPRISTAQQQIQEKAQGSRDKGKAKVVEEEEPKEPTKIKAQIKHDEELAQRLDAQLQAEMEKEDRLARQREEEDNIVSWDNAQAMMEADYQMAERLHAAEQASLTDEEKASLFVQLLDARKKHFAALRAQEIRNKPPTKMQKRTTMCNYLKNMAGYKHNQLRHKSFDDIQKLFDKALKRVNTFVPMDTEKVEGSKAKAAGSETRVEESSKRAGEELDRESTKKQKIEDETEQAELKECFEIIPFDEDAVNTIPLATKQAPIVDYKITRDARKIYYHITRADGSTKVYMRFEDMLKMFDREDLEVLYRIVKDRFKSTKPVGDNRVLWGNLMTMFEPSACDEMWRE